MHAGRVWEEFQTSSGRDQGDFQTGSGGAREEVLDGFGTSSGCIRGGFEMGLGLTRDSFKNEMVSRCARGVFSTAFDSHSVPLWATRRKKISFCGRRSCPSRLMLNVKPGRIANNKTAPNGVTLTSIIKICGTGFSTSKDSRKS